MGMKLISNTWLMLQRFEDILSYLTPLTTTAAMSPCDVAASTEIEFSHGKVKCYTKR